MGQEIADSHFTAADFQEFSQRLRDETALLADWLEEEEFPSGEEIVGYELEAWLIDESAGPMPVNQPLLDRLDDPLVVPELARFNLEFNGTPLRLSGDVFSQLADELTATWNRCNAVANNWGARLAMIGILPTVEERHLNTDNMSFMQRYQALDEQLRRIRGGDPLRLDIRGRDRLAFTHQDVMLESATTSFQIHLQSDRKRAGRLYNAAKLVSAPMVALAANSPYLFGAELWDETRIPLFEQAVQMGGTELNKRVTLGREFVGSIIDCFWANIRYHRVLLPQLMDEPPEQLAHLRLHNGTIWRWNRPLIGFNAEGEPRIRIEHRVVPAGPTIADSIANMAFYTGIVFALARQQSPPERLLSFEDTRHNFYRAARHGLEADITWLDGANGSVSALCERELLPLAESGLDTLGIVSQERDYWLGIIRSRLKSGLNGSNWQRAWVKRHGPNMQRLTEAYIKQQESGRPVHQWSV